LLAVGLTLLLFANWWFTGYAVLSVLRRRRLLQNMLLAPAVGLSVCVMLVFTLNRAGIPISKFGPVLAICILSGAALVWWRGRLLIPGWQYAPFAALFLAALLLVGWPMYEYGLNWVSISNGDMANYCLAAERVYKYGFFDGLSPVDLVKNKDISAYFWYMHVPGGARPGSEMLLAFLMSVTRLSSHQVFMPAIVALHLSLLSSAGAIFLSHHRLRGWALMALAILCCSAEFTLGTVYQLIAQVFGLTLFAASALLLMSQRNNTRWGPVLKDGLLISIVFSAAMVVYTEMIPLLGFTCLLFWLHQLVQRRFIVGMRGLLTAGAMTFVFLNSYGPIAIRYMLGQARSGRGHFASGEGGPVLYPFFLLPSAPVHFWGLAPFNIIPPEPVLSIGIIFGGVLLLVSVVVSIREALHGAPSAIVAVGMFIAAAVLALADSDYGLFKIAMYIQPFLIPTLVGSWMRFTSNNGGARCA
jgi:hypothetical protein